MEHITVINKPDDDAFFEMKISLQAEIMALSAKNDTLTAKVYSLELENTALRGAESAAIQELNTFTAKAKLLDEAIKLLRASYKGYRLDSEDHMRITQLIESEKEPK